MSEKILEECVRKYLNKKGWDIEAVGKSTGEHGCDIIAFHSRWRKRIFVEVKSENPSSKYIVQDRHNKFPVLIGQIISRMDMEGNRPNRARIYSIAVPKTWEGMICRKVQGMKFSWRWMRLKVFLIDAKGNVEEKSYTHFLK